MLTAAIPWDAQQGRADAPAGGVEPSVGEPARLEPGPRRWLSQRPSGGFAGPMSGRPVSWFHSGIRASAGPPAWLPG